MATIQYTHGSMFGTFMVDCNVLDKKDNNFKISFLDPHTREQDERWVGKDELDFPKFSDMVM